MPDQIALKLVLNPTTQTDDRELDHLTRQLRQEILELDVQDVVSARAGESPTGSKGDAVTLGALLVTALASSGAIPPLIGLLKEAIERYSLRSITLELDGDKLEVKGISSREQQELIDAWMGRHPLILTARK